MPLPSDRLQWERHLDGIFINPADSDPPDDEESLMAGYMQRGTSQSRRINVSTVLRLRPRS